MKLISVVFYSALAVGLGAGQIVDLGYAKYKGTVSATTGNTIFLGIRYAAPPSGIQRWRLPKVPDAVSETMQANTQPAGCPAAGAGGSPVNPFPRPKTNAVSEDCLFLNVVTPQMPAAGKISKPVIVWIHGGGYQAGSASSYNGEDLVRDANGGVVAVIIQYRLGVYGFLAGNEVKTGGILNAGLLDQEFALQWVQKHIGKFGGDPSRVTIWGESAGALLSISLYPPFDSHIGAGSVLQHVIAHNGRTSPPLFRGAISSSSFLPSQYSYNDAIPQTLYNEVVSQTGCTAATETLACLRTVDSTTLQAANTNISNHAFFGTFIFVPVVDGDFITQRPTQALKENKVNGKALLAVTNTFEGFNFVDQNTASTVSIPNYVSQLFPKFGMREIQRATAQYADLGTPLDQAIAIMGEAIFICPTYFMLRAFRLKAYKGVFGIPPSHHGDDLRYYFSSMNPSGLPPYNNPDFDKAFSESFLDFVASLNPNIKSDPPTITPFWNVWAGNAVEMLFNKTLEDEPVVKAIKTSNLLLQRCSFWESVGALSGQ